MDFDFFSFKELDDVYLKATYPLEINGVSFEEGETVARFDKISIAALQEIKSQVSARGGYDNRARVYWETTREVAFQFSQGVFSKTQFSLFTNSNVLKLEEETPLRISYTERLESDEGGKITPTHVPFFNLYLYDADSGRKMIYGNRGTYIAISDHFKDVIIDYEWEYTSGASVAMIGQKFLNGFLSFEGKTRVKDDTTGQIKTGILKIPRLKLTSDLSIRLGTQANPVVANFTAVGVPEGTGRYDSRVAELYFLETNID